MNKTDILVRALRKNGRSLSAVRSLGKESLTISPAALTGPLVPALLAVASGVLAWLLSAGPWSGLGLPLGALLEAFCTGLTVMCVIFSLMKLITAMYLSDDLQVLLTLPFSEGQIAMAKTRIVAEKRYLHNACVLIPFTAVWAILKGASVNELIAAALMVVFLPGLVMCVTGIAVMVLMRFVRFIRNKNLLKIVGSVLGLLVLNAAIYFIQSSPAGNDGNPYAFLIEIMNVSSAMRTWIPTTGLIADIIETGRISSMLLFVAAAMGAYALYQLAAKFLYFKAALSMSEASDARRVMKPEELLRAMASHKPLQALMRRDRNTILRTPAFLSNCLVSPLISSVVTCLLITGGLVRAMDTKLMGRNISVSLVFGVCGMTAILAFVSNISAAGSAFTREGATFSALWTMPIEPKTLLRAKRNTALRFGILCSLLPAAAFMIGLCVMGKLPPLALLFGPGFCIAALWLLADILILTDLRSPNFIWENPGDIRQSTLLSLLTAAGVAAVMAAAIYIAYRWRIYGGFGYAGCVVYGALTLLTFAAAAIFDRFYLKKGTALLARL